MPESISDTRRNLDAHMARFREEGLWAEPVVLGDRRPEAVLMPYASFQLLLDVVEGVVGPAVVRERLAADGGNRATLADAATAFGIDLDGL